MKEHIDWREFARCVTSVDSPTPEQFFHENTGDNDPCIKCCTQCPVRQLCLNYAIENSIPYGIWGGMLPTQRAKLIRRNHEGFLRLQKRAQKLGLT